MWLHRLHILALFVVQAWGLHEGDVGIIDWHKRSVGVPLVNALETAPKFHHVGSESLLLTATASNVLAALHGNGSVAWRFLFDPEDRINSFYVDADVVTTLSGRGGATLRKFEALTGHVITERKLHSHAEGIPSQPQQLGNAVAYAANDDSPSADGPRDLIVLTNGNKVARLDGTTGQPKWAWASPDQSSLVIYTKVFSTSYAVYAIGVSKSLASYTLHVTSLLSSTGELLNAIEVPSTIAQPVYDLILLGHHASYQYRPRIAWLQGDQIKSKALTPDLKNPTGRVKNLEFDRIMDVGVSDYGFFVGFKKGSPARVLKLEEDGTLIRLWGQFDKVSSEEAEEISYGGGVDNERNAYVARVYWSNSLKKAVVDLFSTSRVQTDRYEFPFDPSSYGSIHHVTLTVSPSLQLVVSTSTGTIQSWILSASQRSEATPKSQLAWNREEALSAISVAEFVELPEPTSVVVQGQEEEGFVGRLRRQLIEAQQRYATGSYLLSTRPTPSNATALGRDPFGFRQLIIAATDHGKVFAIDAVSGEITWSRVLGLGWAEQKGPDGKVIGGRVDVVKIYVIKPVGSGVGKKQKGKKGKRTKTVVAADEVTRPEIVLLAQRQAGNSLVDTVIFHVDALTGADLREDVPNDRKSQGLLQGLDIIQGPMTEAYLLQNETRIVVMLDEFQQVLLYPENEETQAIFAGVASSLSFPLSATIEDSEAQKRGARRKKRIVGNGVELNDELSDRYVAYQTWTLSFPYDENLQVMVPATKGPAASIGKVLGNRTTLYKYLNGKLFGVLTEVTTGTCGLYIVDATKGSIIYRASLPAADGYDRSRKVCDVKMILTENWLVYHYYDGEIASGTAGQGETKGWKMVSVEMYEGPSDQKSESPDMSSYNPDVRNVTLFEQAHVFPYGVSAIGTTSTKFGITSKDIIVATHNHKIYAIPRRLLDPRRPQRRPTAEEQEEMLDEYDPLIPDDPKRTISHSYEVANVRGIITSPALLESTSLVFAYGLDLFLTRVSPSGTFDVLNENFNKAQLVFTVLGLTLAITFTRPMVKRKMLKQKWYWK